MLAKSNPSSVSYPERREDTEFIYDNSFVAREKLNERQELSKKEGY